MRILFVIGSLHVGGAEKQMLLLIRGLVQRGFSCEVFAFDSDGPLLEELHQLGTPVHNGRYKYGPRIIRFAIQLPKILLKLLWLIQKKEYDIVHSFLPLANFAGISMGRLCNVPLLISSKRALGRHQERYRLSKYLDDIANRYSHIVTVNSMAVWCDVVSRESVCKTKLRLIYNGIDTTLYSCNKTRRECQRAIHGITKNQVVIVMVANLIPYKGHEDAIQALSLVHRRYSHVIMLFAGQDREIRHQLEHTADELGVLSSTRFLGGCDDIPSVLCAADIGLVASHEEGFCNALLEEMAASLPVIATDVGGNREALDNGRVGIIVPSHDPVRISQAVFELVNDLDASRALGRLAYHRVNVEYTIERMVNNYSNLYR